MGRVYAVDERIKIYKEIIESKIIYGEIPSDRVLKDLQILHNIKTMRTARGKLENSTKPVGFVMIC